MRLGQVAVEQQPTIWVPIGASGSGKSTISRALRQQNPNLLIFSFDDLRHEWYDQENYANAFKQSTEDPQFSAKANQRFLDLISTGKDIFVDNTNLTPKRRRFYLQEARRRGYRAVAIVFDVDLPTIIARQKTRGDKEVPELAVTRQFDSLVPPQMGEFDEILTNKDFS